MVSSYTPTLAALISARRKSKALPLFEARILPVDVPDAPGYPPLKNTSIEIDLISRTVPPTCLLPQEVGPTVHSIISRLSTSDQSLSPSILHLACHGQQVFQDPLESGFVMQDGLLTISRLMRIEMPNAFLAVLSACESAMGDRRQPHEAVHLAASMLFAGFKSVLATMWCVRNLCLAPLQSTQELMP